MGRLRAAAIFELADKALALHVVRRAFVVVVEADFAAGDHLGLRQQGVELGQGVVVDFGCVVGIDAGARVEPGHVGPAR